MTFRPSNELQNLSGCIGVGFGLAFLLAGILDSGPDTFLPGRILVALFGLAIIASSLYSFWYYWITDELITTPDHFIVWSKKSQHKFG